MAINSLDSVRRPSQNFQIEQIQQKKSDLEQTETEHLQRREDTLELSTTSRTIVGSQLTERLQQVQLQANAGFYNNPEVLRQTAVRIAQTFKNSNDEQVESTSAS
ncbi:MAG: hypothetical protein IPM69_17875 [Ignavibacteria bacterium]|nr:hypothetical protein [Ignavibacteria bacterium]